ncbi:SDR family NAD(P)-dependent oxidoreductase [Mycobacterium bourgelatii]|uniref:Short-chain type dehydrogenase/reductase n=1 Tax=Mycobacterium bourgelatii TaxID=1273442 RepID=A0A7I9YKZ8_MYCBU|nr:SDR family NAD(P)-dependent oxidoreductase [Mycobacterium bourgelatii]MCV6975709.1 SDR family NAD(P)-dependent oxidoreductase [Mycobacterium bourgelatii]GFG89309.1 short-chain type dehydrogenase/reductase [Mycobacterium bourgelatii]
MGTIKGKVAVVTGAGSGIGRALAVGLARRGARVAMSDVNKDGLADTAERTRALRAETHVEVLDVTDREAVNDYAASVTDHFGVVHQLYNNAGVAGGAAPVIDCDYETYERIFGINVWGVIHGTKAFLPHLINSGDGHLVNISSLNGLMAQASMSAYCTSKFAVRGFTESVRAEMLAAGHPVQVVVVHPGGIRTNIATAAIDEAKRAGKELSSEQLKRAEAYNDKLLKMSPTKAADTILNGVQANRSRVLVGNDARGVDLLVRLLPRQYPRLGVWWERRTFGRS